MSWSESSQTPISATLFPPASSHQILWVMQRHSVNTWDGQFGMKHHRDAGNLEPVSPKSCFQQEKDVGLVKMLPRILHHSRQGRRMTTAMAALLSPLRALRLAHSPSSASSQKLYQPSLAPKHPRNQDNLKNQQQAQSPPAH